jgi:hypothetical protein
MKTRLMLRIMKEEVSIRNFQTFSAREVNKAEQREKQICDGRFELSSLKSRFIHGKTETCQASQVEKHLSSWAFENSNTLLGVFLILIATIVRLTQLVTSQLNEILFFYQSISLT